MDSSSKLRKTGFFYTFLTVCINAAVNMVTTMVPSPNIEQDTVNRWIQFVNDTNASFLAIFVPYGIPLLFCLCYFLRRGSEEKLKRRAVAMPLTMSLASLGGWLSNFAILIPFALYAKHTLGIPIRLIIIASGISSLLIGISTSTIIYLVLEGLNQRILLPSFFPEGRVSSAKTLFRPTFSVLLVMAFIISSLMPAAYLLYGMISLLTGSGLPVHRGLIVITATLLLAAVAVTFMLARKIVRPLMLFTQAAERIKEGDYSMRLGIITNDEMGSLADTFNDMTASLAEKEFMRDTFGRVVDPHVRDYLMKSRKQLSGKTIEVTVLFCDIRSFTAMSEKMEAAAVVSLLNRYFTVLGECIGNHGGIINKYIGDAIMAIFGAPIASESHALDAYRAAIDMRQALAKLNTQLRSEGKPELRFGIGIHTGRVFAGTIGAASRMEYTIIGDTVNTASRIESLCKSYGTDLLLSAASAARLDKDTARNELRFVENADIRGKESQIPLYTLNTSAVHNIKENV